MDYEEEDEEALVQSELDKMGLDEANSTTAQ